MAANNIPLHCNICPKKPSFSDVSHLLTHIASKGHLSNYYKVKVRSGSEEGCRRLIEAYDQWYAEWNVEQLMSERMTQKDKRRMRARPLARATVASVRIEAPIPLSTRPRAAVSNLLDPRLSEQLHQNTVKVEHSVTPAPQPGPVLRQRPFATRMQYWPMDSRSTSQSYTNPDYETSSEYSEPGDRGRQLYRVDDSCAIEDDPADTPAMAADDPMAVSESTKLKGVYWPGMDIFDSATPEMRRKRNQKKDSSVVQQLELNSQEVEPNELIFTPEGTLKRERRISASFDDEEDECSPIRSKGSRPSLTRPALANLDVNTNRRPRQSARAQPIPFPVRGQRDSVHSRPDFGTDGRAQRKRRAFDVFQDDEIFAQPAPFTYLTAGFRPYQASPSPGPTYAQPKSFNGLYHEDIKENIMSTYRESMYDQHHHHPSNAYQFHAYSYGLGHDPHAFQYHNHLYMNNAYQQQAHEDADDQRTLTAPPSPSTG